MTGKRKFERLLEPGYIGSVRTRNRIIKTGAGLLMWHENDIHMREEVKAIDESIARGGVGLLIVAAPAIDYLTTFKTSFIKLTFRTSFTNAL
jgi:2,4-dienoyl-CoA reductase-like NADH-dependent reductase (Old Yellow Enzyme family)